MIAAFTSSESTVARACLFCLVLTRIEELVRRFTSAPQADQTIDWAVRSLWIV